MARGPLPLRRAVGAVADLLTVPRRLAWLNEAGERIGTTLDLERTAGELAEFTVPRLADGCAVDLLESILRGEEGDRWRLPGTPVTRAMAVAQIDGLDLEPDPVGHLSTHTPEGLSSRCLETREPVLVTRMTSETFNRIAPTRSAALKMRREGVHSYMAVPLIARGVLLGAADFIRVGKRPPFSTTDLALAMELASKAAVFIDNARLYGREREHVVTLQRALLPRVTPSTPGLDVASCYTPTPDPGRVGGDWFDVVALPSGRTALMVGDVMGRGLSGAATMGSMRSVARTLMALDIAPERVLARLDLAARDLEEDQVATCLCAVYDAATATFRMASAGHPPPLLLFADGEAQYVDVPVGGPIGAGVIPYDPVECRAPDGGGLLLFTDGLIKSRTEDLDTQLELLREAARGLRPGEGNPCELLSARMGGDRSDDAIVLVAGTKPLEPEAEVRVWTLSPDGSAAGEARKIVKEQLELWGMDDLVEVTELVVSELVGNALRYGGAPGELRLIRYERLCVEVSDTGPDLPQIQPVSLIDEGGRGLQLINMLCRRWGSCRTTTGKVVWAEQDIPAGSGTASGLMGG
ncbi:ATP-binding SpoIIE family protein phosphatase [Wenjunlia tyrosinilytica]|nr:SpoIIE family protein phosphatase [Wenjunlia tyrosinilytica]